jgi:hypothetical protein
MLYAMALRKQNAKRSWSKGFKANKVLGKGGRKEGKYNVFCELMS